MKGASASSRTPDRRLVVSLLLDLGLTLGFMLLMQPRLSGLALHEWLGLGFTALLAVHLLLHGRWVAAVTRQFWGRLTTRTRYSFVLSAALLFTFMAVVLTGALISQIALPPQPWVNRRLLRHLHHLSAGLSVLLVGLHLVLHWPWVVRAARRVFLRG